MRMTSGDGPDRPRRTKQLLLGSAFRVPTIFDATGDFSVVAVHQSERAANGAPNRSHSNQDSVVKATQFNESPQKR